MEKPRHEDTKLHIQRILICSIQLTEGNSANGTSNCCRVVVFTHGLYFLLHSRLVCCQSICYALLSKELNDWKAVSSHSV